MGDGSSGEDMEMNKKAQIFTILAIVLIGLVFLSFEIFSFVDNQDSVKDRVETMSGFLDSVEKNMERQVFISGFRIIFLAEDEVAKKGVYVPDMNSFLDEAFFEGSVGGVVKNDSGGILNGATYYDMVNSLKQKANKINVDVSMTNPVISIKQDDPWNLNFTLEFDFVMVDKSNLSRWERQQQISSLVPVQGFEDPVFTANSLARISRKINKTVYDGNYASGGDVSNLLNHVNQGYYSENSDAPSFLKRLEGDLSSDSNGIESFVDLQELSAQGISTQDKTVVDHIYFSTSNPSASTVSGMPAWFKIDDVHRTKYQV